MKRTLTRSAATFVVLCVVLVPAILAMKVSQASPAVAASSASVSLPNVAAARWEYQTMVAKSPEALTALANQGGTDSWELVSAVQVLNQRRYEWVGFFKRIKR